MKRIPRVRQRFTRELVEFFRTRERVGAFGLRRRHALRSGRSHAVRHEPDQECGEPGSAGNEKA